MNKRLEITSHFMKKESFYFSRIYGEIIEAFISKGLPTRVKEDDIDKLKFEEKIT